MKYTATITIEQEDNGTVDLNVEFEPALNRKKMDENPMAYALALLAMEKIVKKGEVLSKKTTYGDKE